MQTLIQRLTDPSKRHQIPDGAKAGIRFEEMGAPDYDAKNRQFWSTINTASVDQVGEVVLPEGINPAYFPTKVKTVYLNHDYNAPVGKCRTLIATASGIRALTYISKTPLGDDVATMIEEGVLGGVSIGFYRTEASEPTPEERGKYPGAEFVTRAWDALEYSVTAMPCNPDAVIDVKGLDLVSNLLAAGRITRKTAEVMGLSDAKPRVVVLVPVITLE